MHHVDFKLTWPDGVSVRIQAEARSPESDVPVKYSGAVDRLPKGAPKAYDVACLRAWAETVAYEQGCSFEDRSFGRYDVWAR